MNVAQNIQLNFVEYNVSRAWPYGDSLMNPKQSSPLLYPKHFVEPIATLSIEQQDEVTAMLDFFDDHQKSLLKEALDEFQAESRNLSKQELGAAFYQIVSDVFDYDDSSTRLNSAYMGLVDMYV